MVFTRSSSCYAWIVRFAVGRNVSISLPERELAASEKGGPRVAPGPVGVQSWSFSVEDRATSEYADSASQANERCRASRGGQSGSQIG